MNKHFRLTLISAGVLALVAAIAWGALAYAAAQKTKQRSAARASINTYLDRESAIKKLLPYYKPTTVSNNTWYADFHGYDCGVMSHNYVDVSTRIMEATDKINDMNSGLAQASIKYQNVQGMKDSVDMLKANQQKLQQLQNQNEQLRQIALDEYGNECGLGHTYSKSAYDSSNSKAGDVIDQMRIEAGQIDQNDDQIKAEMQ